MFSDYEIFGSGFLPLLALSEGMLSDLSANSRGRRQASNTTQIHRGTTISPPALILAFYTAQLFCRLLTYALARKERFSYDNWIWLPQWTIQTRRKPNIRLLLERRGLGLDMAIKDSGMLWIPPSSLDWYGGHIALEVLVQLYIPRNPFQRGLVSQMSIQRFTVSKVAIEVCLRQLLQHARSEFEHGRRHAAEELVDRVLRLATEEIARAYHQHMLSKLKLKWEDMRKEFGQRVLPRLERLEQSEEESARQTGCLVTAQTIWEIYDEAWTTYVRTRANSEVDDKPEDVPLWMGTRKYLPRTTAGQILYSIVFSNVRKPHSGTASTSSNSITESSGYGA
ncbi:hypothetical protein NOF04DRAFT_1390045 [Fusarium oxysporum II5]|nr:hypothetical protein NOF04DRAFT_1390045 [Fusarium oxysporum II5]